jgi:hypothetical protein
MNMKDVPLFDSAFPLRVIKDEDGLYQIWTAQDNRLGSLNNFAVATGIQTKQFANWVCRSLNERKR